MGGLDEMLSFVKTLMREDNDRVMRASEIMHELTRAGEGADNIIMQTINYIMGWKSERPRLTPDTWQCNWCYKHNTMDVGFCACGHGWRVP